MVAITEQLQHLQQYLQAVEEQLQETEAAIISIDELSKMNNANAYVPMTSGIYVKATLSDTQSFLLNVGNNLITAHSATEAKQMLGEQLDELRQAQEQLTKQFSEAYQHYISAHMEAQ